MRILIVEDEEKLARLIEEGLSDTRTQCTIALTGEQGLAEAMRDIYDLIILDVMLPELSGFEILKSIRKKGLKSKVILLTARGSVEDKVHGLSQGANDYVTKPFHMAELKARVNVQLLENGAQTIRTGDLEIPMDSNVLKCIQTNEAVELSARELTLMEFLMRNSGQILTRDTLFDRVWGLESDVSNNNLEAYLSFLRRKLKAIGSSAKIKAVRGLGYRLETNP